MKKIFYSLASLRLTVVLLILSTVVVFFGTLDQANYGIHHTQEKYFESWIILSPVVSLLALVLFKTYPTEWEWAILPLPGGLLLGALLVVNLSCAHIRYYRPGWKRLGIVLTHSGLILLIISGFLGSFFQEEWQMVLDEGGRPVNHISAIRGDELVLVDVSDSDGDTHYVLPSSLLRSGQSIEVPGTGLQVRVLDIATNAELEQRNRLIRTSGEERAADLLANPGILLAPLSGEDPITVDPEKIRGLASGQNIAAIAVPTTYRHDETNFSTAVVELSDGEEILGIWLVSTLLDLVDGITPQTFRHDGKEYELALRFPREYLPFELQLLDFIHRRHPNTDIPAEFASEVVLQNEAVGENREVRISMNRPLRHAGYTFYQASFANNDQTSILQVVRNPSWLIPYLSIVIVGLGLVIHFCLKLLRLGEKGVRTRALEGGTESDQKGGD